MGKRYDNIENGQYLEDDLTLILFRGLEKLLGVLRNIIEETYPLSLKSYTLSEQVIFLFLFRILDYLTKKPLLSHMSGIHIKKN